MATRAPTAIGSSMSSLQDAITELRLDRSHQMSRLALVEKRLKEIDERNVATWNGSP